MKKDQLTPLNAIRAKCLDCCVGSRVEVRRCEDTDCSLLPFRFGHNPRRSGIGRKNGKFRKKAKLSNSFSEEQIKGGELDKDERSEKKVKLSSCLNISLLPHPV